MIEREIMYEWTDVSENTVQEKKKETQDKHPASEKWDMLSLHPIA